MLISVVERQSFKRCRRMWDLSADTRQNLQTISVVKPLVLGGIIQEALSEWTENPTLDPVESFARLSREALEDYSNRYKEHIGAPISEEELDPLYEVIGLGMAMTTNYRDYYKHPLPRGYHAIQTEQRAIIEIPNTSHWECNTCHYLPSVEFITEIIVKYHVTLDAALDCPECAGEATITWQNHQLRGTMDTLVHDDKGKIHILERKTYGQRPSPDKLQHDDQMLAYLAIMTQLVGKESMGGILYDGLWKRAKPPASKTNGRPTNIDDLFFRQIFLRPPEEIDEFWELLAKDALDMQLAIQHNLITINRQWAGCWDCSVERLCSAMSCGEDADYVRDTFYQQRKYPMLTVEEEE